MGEDRYMGPDNTLTQRLANFWTKVQEERGESIDRPVGVHTFIPEAIRHLPNVMNRWLSESPLQLLWTLMRNGAAVVSPGGMATAIVGIEKNQPYRVLFIDSHLDNPEPAYGMPFTKSIGPEGRIKITRENKSYLLREVQLIGCKDERG